VCAGRLCVLYWSFVCAVLVVSLKITIEKSGYDVQNGHVHFVLEEDFVCELCQGYTVFWHL
jgi:hypothetical protein